MLYNLELVKDQQNILVQAGIDFEEILLNQGINWWTLENNNYQVTEEQFKALISSMNELMNESLIIRLASVDTFASFNPEFFSGLCAENGIECVKRIAKYKGIVAPVRINIFEEDENIRVSYLYNDNTSIPKMMVLFAQVSLLSIIRRGTGLSDLSPIEVMGDFDYSSEILDYYQCKSVIKSNMNGLVFRRSDLLRPFITKNNKMWDLLEKSLNQKLRQKDVDQSFSEAVRNVLMDLLPSGISDVDKVSFELGVSKRTLQRRLKEENTSFNTELIRTRELMVRNYLKMGMRLDEIAFLVNYSDPKSLSRAFKAWTGMKVKDYRLSLK